MGLFEARMTVEDVIHNCTQLIERDAMVAGAGNRMRNPLLSVFLGTDSISHIPEIQSTYFSCWSAQARKLKMVKGIYTREEIAMQLANASMEEGYYAVRNMIRVAWYWDIMDNDFEQQFECIKQDVTGPIGMQILKSYFIFCSQRDFVRQKITEDRLKRVLEWAKETGAPITVLSDATRDGLLDAKGLTENYHMAASIVLLLNSASGQHGSDMGINLDFRMRQNTIWTASYCACSKNFFDIIGVSLLKIIHKYQEMSKVQMRVNEAQSRICGENGNYITFLDDVFDKVIADKCPDEQQISFWMDLPYTQDMVALERLLAGEVVRSGGLFGRLFNKNNTGDPANAIASVMDFWNACVNEYYIAPVQAWLTTEEGRTAVTDHIYGKMTAVLTLNDMKTQLLAECDKLNREVIYQNLTLMHPQPEQGISLAAYLHSCACVEVKRQIYGELLKKVGAIMRELNQNADGFEAMLHNVSASLQGIQMDPNIDRAYGNRMAQIIESNQAVLNQKIHPCASEMELLIQLETAFEELVKRDQEQVYYYTLQEDMNFQMRAGAAAAADNIIAACFDVDMTRAGRLVTMSEEPGELFCMMNDRLRGLIANQNIGTQFIVNRCDRIERLYLYPVRPETIVYS